MSAEDSINRHHNRLAKVLIRGLLSELKLPKDYPEYAYKLKDDAVYRIADRLERDGVRFTDIGCRAWANKIYHEFYRTPLRQVGYGMLNAQLPMEVAQQLRPYEALYAYAGVWAGKSAEKEKYQFSETTLRDMTLYQIVRDIVFRGLDRIVFIHNQQHRKGRYKSRLSKAPHEEEVRERLAEPRYKTIPQMKKGAQMQLF